MEFNRLIPELAVSDFSDSLRFYKEILGFKVEYDRPECRFAFISLQGSQLMIEQDNGNWHTGNLEKPYGRGINLQIEVEEISPLLESLKEHGYKIFLGPMDNWYRKGDQLLGCREFLVQDPDGYLLRFSEYLGSRPADA